MTNTEIKDRELQELIDFYGDGLYGNKIKPQVVKFLDNLIYIKNQVRRTYNGNATIVKRVGNQIDLEVIDTQMVAIITFKISMTDFTYTEHLSLYNRAIISEDFSLIDFVENLKSLVDEVRIGTQIQDSLDVLKGSSEDDEDE